jgi:hypothetical protein
VYNFAVGRSKAGCFRHGGAGVEAYDQLQESTKIQVKRGESVLLAELRDVYESLYDSAVMVHLSLSRFPQPTIVHNVKLMSVRMLAANDIFRQGGNFAAELQGFDVR